MILFVFNPVSGRSGDKTLFLGRVVEKLSQGGRLVAVYQTTGKNETRRFVREALKSGSYSELIVSGGDGTLHEVLNGMLLAEADIPIGYIPSGSTNDFARNLGINKRNALKTVSEKRLKRLDVGQFNHEFFSYVAAFGNFTNIPFSTDQNKKNSIGYFAYIIEALGSLPDVKPFHARIATEGLAIEDDFALGLFTNSYYTAGFKNISNKTADLTDGLLDYVLIKMPENPRDFSDIVAGLINGTHDDRLILTGSGKKFTVNSDAMRWTLDGEDGGEHDHCSIQAVPGRIQIYSNLS
ncbi:MAG: YegS/Rv2252/BmrU family lipid kinase [Lachnospiraceae bacterium]|nr:YegS/Rv2252/BmrU family lipid kinase [Lachnospiraceae bacterium]